MGSKVEGLRSMRSNQEAKLTRRSAVFCLAGAILPRRFVRRGSQLRVAYDKTFVLRVVVIVMVKDDATRRR